MKNGKEIDRQKKVTLFVLEIQKVLASYYKDVTKNQGNEQRHLAVAISQLAGIDLDRPARLNDIPS